jgi:hypothetical protein
MVDRLFHFCAYGVIFFTVIWWPANEHIVSCLAYGVLLFGSLVGLGIAVRRAVHKPMPGTRDLRDGLPGWP